ncbi:2,3-bisphosphoglycerate-dependent phosphoglycerate mutase-like [Adelges cooleyi]|uniref:2,3-bisphosphoglycerate-dependent phosphoglycerate mutase-like n=1 Tax=Adelges cooleyi TaxID=133065 RepID=UPI00217F9AB9|nr:2,3-bisphosphoglycerate-dependent phosphoglycerate mutase-like [Adelges cooleyi]
MQKSTICIIVFIIMKLSLVTQGGPFPEMTKRRTVVMVRHGMSQWSEKNVFCGWYDSELSERGLDEAHECGRLMKSAGYYFDIVFTSLLTRAHQTLDVVAKYLGQPDVQVIETWRLNERHYGALTGYVKGYLVDIYGEKQVQIWRRSFDVKPPAMGSDHKYYDAAMNNPKLKKYANEHNVKFPVTESLKETMKRVIPFWEQMIAPAVRQGQRVLIVAHGTVLRSLVKYLEGISNDDICSINIPSGIPFFYKFDEYMQVVSTKEFLGDPKRVQEGIARAASSGTIIQH